MLAEYGIIHKGSLRSHSNKGEILLRLNPNPRIEKLKDYRNSTSRKWWCRCDPWFFSYANRQNRKRWRQNRWQYEYNEQLSFSSYNPRHQVLWDLA